MLKEYQIKLTGIQTYEKFSRIQVENSGKNRLQKFTNDYLSFFGNEIKVYLNSRFTFSTL